MNPKDLVLAAADAQGLRPSSASLSQTFRSISFPDIFDCDFLAERLNLPRSGVMRALRSGRLPGRRLGRRWIMSRQAVLAWLAAPEIACRLVRNPSEMPDV